MYIYIYIYISFVTCWPPLGALRPPLSLLGRSLGSFCVPLDSPWTTKHFGTTWAAMEVALVCLEHLVVF